MNRVVLILVTLAAVAAASWKYPMFHVLRRTDVETKNQAERFDAAKLAEEFWKERLTPAFADAADAAAVLAALANDADSARKQFGRTVGLSRATFFLVRGKGSIIAVDKARLGVSLAGGASQSEPDLWLATGPVFGNAVRDATGLIKSQDFAHSQRFNELAGALNALVEQRVATPLRTLAKSGQLIEFAACIEVPGGKVRQPLTLIPLEATVQ